MMSCMKNEILNTVSGECKEWKSIFKILPDQDLKPVYEER